MIGLCPRSVHIVRIELDSFSLTKLQNTYYFSHFSVLGWLRKRVKVGTQAGRPRTEETTVTLLDQTTEVTMTVLGERKVTIDKDNSIYTTLKDVDLSNTSTKNRDPNNT